MSKIYVIGHKNPDTDSVCAPYCYAWLKNRLDKNNTYQPGILGTINSQTRYIFQTLKLTVPPLLRDIHPKAEDVMLKEVFSIEENEPIGTAIRIIEEYKIRTLPVVNETKQYKGIISMLELADFFLPGKELERPYYLFRPENFEIVLSGFFLRKDNRNEFKASLMVGAMAYETFIQRLHEHVGHVPDASRFPVLVVGNRFDIIDFAVTQNFPALILTGLSVAEAQAIDLQDYQGWVFVSHRDTSETIRILRTSVPVKAIANTQMPTLNKAEYLDTIKSKLRRIDHHGIAVVENGRLCGLVTSSRLVDPPKHQLILIDHNEMAQSIDGVEQAEIIEIIDHHRLGSVKTSKPIYVYARPLGSSCTLVWQHFEMADITPEPDIAALLLAGILTDTVILKSPTTTPEDILAAELLARMANLDISEWGRDIFRHAASLVSSNPDEVVSADMKTYVEYGSKVGIAQVEVVTLEDLSMVKTQYFKALDNLKAKHSLNWAMLMITDISKEESILLSTDFSPANQFMRYHESNTGVWLMPGVLSRKKQLLPEVLRVLELAGNHDS
jgi:manganese-dependent inorganic pyrophosphatase